MPPTTQETPARELARKIEESETIRAQLEARARDHVSPEAMSAAAHHVDHEYGGYGYRIAVAESVYGHGIFEVTHLDGSRFLLVADRYGNVERPAA